MSAVDALQSVPQRPARSVAAAPASAEFIWRVLTLLNLFRFGVGVILLGVFYVVTEPHIVGEANAPLALGAMGAMVTFSIVNFWLLRERRVGARAQAYLQLVLDLVAITMLMHASGGISSGVGGLLVVSVGALALVVERDRAYFAAALGTIAILSQQTFAQLQGAAATSQYASTGILGAVVFVIAMVAQALRSRLLETEALAEQRGVDLRNLGELNQYIVQHLRESIVVVDGDDRIRLMNESAASHLGATGRRSNQPLSDLSPELANRLEVWRVQGRPHGMTSPKFSAADGSTTITPHFAALGNERTGGTLIFLEDMALLAERAQTTKLASLGRLSASIAHEIRNPVGAMSHAGQLLAESPAISTSEQRLTHIIRVNAARVSQIVDSMLTLSRRDTTQPEQIRLGAWLEQFCREFVQTLELFEDAVNCGAVEDEIVVRIDPTHLHQVIWNLCDNAVKYASEAAGAITVELSCGVLEHSGRAFVEVADRGPGIDPEKIDEIFEPFYTGKDGGTGLGLYICRELCECNGASLSYHARHGGGSVFRIVFADTNRWQ